MFDLTRSYFNDIKEREVAPGATITEEAQCLVYVSDGAGNMSVQPSAGAGGELVAGFAITDSLSILTGVSLETYTIPSTAPYTVSVKYQNVITASAYVFNNTTSAAMTASCPTPSSSQYCLTTAGLMTFNAAQAGNSFTITYRFTYTTQQVLNIWHTRSVNNFAQAYFSQVSVGALEGEIFTTMFDTSQAYSIGSAIYSGAGGLVTSAAGGTSFGIVSSLSSATTTTYGATNNQVALTTFLGVKFKGLS